MIKKIIISGGGTGGHIFPAIAIANALKNKSKDIEILFVGALGKMEMEKVPAAGYSIIGLPVAGFQRRLTLKNFTFFIKLFKSLRKARKIIGDFKPDVVVGVGGYASGPVLFKAAKKGIPTLIQEQNSYAGVTNRMLANKARIVCTAYTGMEKYFPAEKIILTGNPVRKDLINKKISKQEAVKHFGLKDDKKVILIIGGSLGARTLNQSVLENLDKIINQDNILILWQTGKHYYKNALNKINEARKNKNCPNLIVRDFISLMDLAYNVADVVISRAGAGTISELCLVAKPTILVPSPNVAEDHQTKNAMALVNNKATILVKDDAAKNTLINQAISLVNNEEKMKELKTNISKMALSDSADKIANEILKLN